MAEWIGHTLAAVPSWLFIPAVIIIIILISVVWVVYVLFEGAAHSANIWPSTSRRNLGEKKYDKK